ncbi:MAG: ABC transporter ATP-binding protein/permease [Spirochaetales bacterium]|jgi:ABC-type multidrug transport system fused ATPase/permease subunit|nr:ABC transporter ATP-binding protein/permease [Spirochaetales bacterium]
MEGVKTVREFSIYVRFLYPDRKKLTLLAALCVPAALFYALVPVCAAAALDSYMDALPAAAGGGLLCLAGWLCARQARHLAAALAAEGSMRIRRRAFAAVLSRKTGFPENAAGAAEMILPAADFLRRFFFLVFLAAVFVYAAGFQPEARAAALAALAAFPVALLLSFSRVFSGPRAPGSPRAAGVSSPADPAIHIRALPAAKALGCMESIETALRATGNLSAPPASAMSAASSPSGSRADTDGTSLAFPLSICAAGLFLSIFAFAAGKLFPDTSAGTWLFCLFAIPAIFLICAQLRKFPPVLRETRAAVETLNKLFALQAPPLQGGVVSTTHLKGELDIRGLSVLSGEQKLLDRISLKVAAGEKLAIAGLSRQTLACLARVVSRLCEYDEGEFLVDGQDIRTLDPAGLREKIDFIPRDPFLFEGTIGENIRYGRPSASEEEILRIVTRLGRGDWLYELPDGLSTATPATGKPAPSWAPLAALARALLKKPALCVIDEPRPVRDPLAEIRIQEAMYSLMSGCTCIVIARRLSTLRQADRIIVFDGNKPAEEGRHEDLLAGSSLYAEIYDTFFRHQSPDYFHDIFEKEKPEN